MVKESYKIEYCILFYLVDKKRMAFYLIVVSIILVSYGLLKIVSFNRIIKFALSKPPISNKLAYDKNLIFVLPVYQEERLIRETVLYYKNYVEKFENVKLIVVGTRKERKKVGINPTLSLINDLQSEKIILLEYPEQDGYMAHQVNYVCWYLKERDFDLAKTWIHLLNIDSRVGNAYFSEAFYYINENISIILQSALFVSNFKSLWWLLKGVSIVQTRRTITWEQRRIKLHNMCSSKLYHVVGHGLLINLKKIFDYHLFPTDTLNEDMHLGYYFSVAWEQIQGMISYEVADVPNSFWDRWKQAAGWFIWAVDYRNYFKLYQHKFWKKRMFRGLLFAIQGLYNAFKWLIISYLILSLIIISLILNNYFFYLLVIISLSCYMYHYLLCIKFLQRKWYIPRKSLCSYLLASFMIVIIKSIPATIWLIKYVWSELKIISFKKYKVSHE